MEATPATCRADIARTREAIRNLERSPMTETDAILHARLGRQLDSLERALARAEVRCAQAQGARPLQGAGVVS